jgi:hypothetical protein
VPAQEISRTVSGASLRRALIALSCFAAVGCAQVTNEPTKDAITTAGPTAAAATLPAAVSAATPEQTHVAPVAALPDSEASVEEPPVAPEPEHAPPWVSPANIAPLPVNVAPEASELALVAPAPPSTEEFDPAPGLTPSLVASPTSAETLDFSSLVTRLRQTKAINFRTKVAVKNESDDLLEQARAYHTQTGETTLAELRRSYDSLLHKLHALLEDADPPLARDIDRSRAAIWELLADPTQFNASI